MLRDRLLSMPNGSTYRQYLTQEERDELESVSVSDRRFAKAAFKNPNRLKAITYLYSDLFLDCPHCGNPRQVKAQTVSEFRQYSTCGARECINKEIASTNMDRYGTHTTLNVNRKQIAETQSKTKEARLAKIRKTNMKRYGVPYPLMNKDIHEKSSRANTLEPIPYACAKCSQVSLWGTKEFSKSMYMQRIKYGYDLCLHCLENNSHRSSAEMEIDEFVRSLGFDTVHYRTREIHFDIVIEEKKTAIEYHGLYWHSEAQVINSYHQWKHDEAKKRGWNLIQIFEDSWFENPDRVKRTIMGKLGMLEKIQARKTKRIEIDRKRAKIFLDDWHMSGGNRMGDINHALEHQGEIISVSSISSKTGELVRYASSHNITGGFKKLFVGFRGWTYLDLKYSDEDNNAYIRNGGQLVGFTPVEYWWAFRGKRYDRRNFTSKKLGGPEMETMRGLGYLRVFGTRHAKFSFDSE